MIETISTFDKLILAPVSDIVYTLLIPFLVVFFISLLLIKKPIVLSNPTTRGLHSHAVPTSGGVSLIMGYIAYIIINQFYFLTVIPILAISIIGFLDDKYGLTKVTRFTAQILFASIIVVDHNFSPLMSFMFVFMIVYFVNSYNFMDGIDTLATFQAIFMSLSLMLLLETTSIPLLALVGILFAFLLFNFTPAKLFLGNSGSYFLGFYMGFLFITLHYHGKLDYLSSLILYTVFLVDTVYVIFKRFYIKLLEGLNSENISIFSILKSCLIHVTQAHCSHNYQKLAQMNNGHVKVVFILMLYNIFWCLPLAILSTKVPEYQILCFVAGCMPYAIWCYINDAGVE